MTIKIGDPRCAYCRDRLDQGANAYNQHMATCPEVPDHLRRVATDRL